MADTHPQKADANLRYDHLQPRGPGLIDPSLPGSGKRPEPGPANYLLFGAVTVAGGLGKVAGGYLGSRLLDRQANLPS